jgi:hypothetical protein
VQVIQLDHIESADRDLGNDVQHERSEDVDEREELARALQPFLQGESSGTGRSRSDKGWPLAQEREQLLLLDATLPIEILLDLMSLHARNA